MQRVVPFLLMLLFALPVSALRAQGTILGTVTDQVTGRPLAEATVTLRGTGRIATSDTVGRFRFPQVAIGTWTLEVRRIGHRPVAVPDVVVRDGRRIDVPVTLVPAPVEVADLVARPDLFAVLDEPGATGFAAEEIRRAPGAAGDVSRIVQSLPSIARVNDQSNGLIVRGGSPQENLILVDGIELPTISHFPIQGSSGGAVSILDIDLVRDVQFAAGGFGARYGDRLASVLDVRLREGSRERAAAQLDLDFVGMGGAAEGPLGRRGSWIVSGRRSWVDLLVRNVDVGSSVAPTFDHLQGKVVRDLGDDHTVWALGVTSGDRLETELETARNDDMLTFGGQRLRQTTAGAGWEARWSPRWRSTTTLAWGRTQFHENYFETATGGTPLQRHRSRDDAVRLRHETAGRIGAHTLRFGGDAVRTASHLDADYAPRTGPFGDPLPALALEGLTTRTRGGLFADADLALTDDVTLTLGVRGDHLDLRDGVTVSPRAALEWRATAATAWRISGGRFHQDQPTVLLLQSAANRRLPAMRSDHLVAGVRHRLDEATRLTVEAYAKWNDRLATDAAFPGLLVVDEPYVDFGFFTAHPALTADGESRARGVEITLQRKLAGRTWGTIGAALFRSEYRTDGGAWRPRAYDNRALVTVEGGWVATPRLTLSARWVAAGGTPYTPIDETASAADGRTILDGARLQGARLPLYHAASVRADYVFRVRGTALTTFLSVWNAYDRRNVAQYYWNTGTARVTPIRQWGLLPVFGISWKP